ncbi:hypothetical protein RJP21_14215 [Paenibacillus sp. VCA1]|uniref:hypothetical protein n=1 Tax=Paenibacillus sp. VCA1 TaxID=3039148 RepID=UPI002871B6E4|nr:hypothetical protein [Paenibacillus sp. VCA1]MDR9854766.1 hypothetical protein [Paenibacillus sp. VCA1]
MEDVRGEETGSCKGEDQVFGSNEKNSKVGRTLIAGSFLLVALPVAAFADSSSAENSIPQVPTAEKLLFEQILEKVNSKELIYSI